MSNSRPNWQKQSIFFLAVFLLSLLGVMVPFTLSQQVVSQSVWIAPVYPTGSSPEVRALQHRPASFAGGTLPAAIEFCIDSSAERIDLLGTAQEQDRTLYLLAAYNDFVTSNPLTPLSAQDELLALHHEGSKQWCERLMPQLGEKIKPLNKFMSTKTALDLELQRYRHWIAQAGGRMQFQHNLTQQIEAAQGCYLLSNEQIQALQQLGIAVPSTYRPFHEMTCS